MDGICSLGGSDGLSAEMLEIERVGSLDGETEGSGPHLGGHDTEGAGHTEHDGVVVVLSEAVVHEEGAGTAVDIGPRVLDLSSGSEALGDFFVVGLDELNEVIVLDVFVGEVELAHETGVSLSEDGVTVAGHNLARSKSVSDKFSNVLSGPSLAVLGLESEQVVEALLVSETVEGTGKTVHTSGEGEVGVGEGGSDQVSGVSRHVTTFVITKHDRNRLISLS